MPSFYDNALTLLAEFVTGRVSAHFSDDDSHPIVLPDVFSSDAPGESPVAGFGREQRLSREAQTLLLLALAPHLEADFYDRNIRGAIPREGDHPQIGCTRGQVFLGYLPTGETALFLLAGEDSERRMEVQKLFSEDYVFARKHILWLEGVPEGEPRMSGRIVLSEEYVDLFTTGRVARPRFSMRFPAQLLETELDWSDLVLHSATLQQIKELEVWVRHGDTLMKDWEMGRKLKPGYRALFHGPPGTGKTLTASLLGKNTGKDVYRIDLSLVVSKFIGETEKTLANLFARAADTDWVLFFDEADALFGKRTAVRDAHDKYDNQVVSYFLQRVEQYSGLVILATNLKSNIDDAFSRRFQSIVYFPAPGVEERVRLWQNAFPAEVKLSDDIDIRGLAQNYEFTGAEITNIVQFASLRSLDRNEELLLFSDLYEGIKREFEKEGRVRR